MNLNLTENQLRQVIRETLEARGLPEQLLVTRLRGLIQGWYNEARELEEAGGIDTNYLQREAIRDCAEDVLMILDDEYELD